MHLAFHLRSCGIIALMCIGRTALAALKMLTDSLDFIHSHLSAKTGGADKLLQDGLFRDACVAVRTTIDSLGGGRRKKREPLVPQTPPLVDHENL